MTKLDPEVYRLAGKGLAEKHADPDSMDVGCCWAIDKACQSRYPLKLARRRSWEVAEPSAVEAHSIAFGLLFRPGPKERKNHRVHRAYWGGQWGYTKDKGNRFPQDYDRGQALACRLMALALMAAVAEAGDA